jgi:hypothetical protein
MTKGKMEMRKVRSNAKKGVEKLFFYGRKNIYWKYKVAKSKGWQS